MKKDVAIQILGGTARLAAQAMGYKSPHAVYMWPDELPRSVADRVNGASQRLKKRKRTSDQKAVA